MMRYGKPEVLRSLDFSGDGGFLFRLSNTLLSWESEADSCLAVNMIPSKQEPGEVDGSLSMLWPIFQSLCLSQFIETLSCSVQGRPVMTETGMTIFEHSLAFAEAEAMVNNQLGLGAFGNPKASVRKKPSVTEENAEPKRLVTKKFLFDRLNTPPEVLLMALISCLNNLSSQILGVLGLQSRFRLINTGIWGLCFMSSFIWGFTTFKLDQGIEAGILRFPTVCIVGFIPHLLILTGISVCACIYFMALLLTVLSPPAGLTRPVTWKGRFQMAQENMQANMQLSNIRLNLHEDFYTALLRTGFTALTAASEAVFLNEGRRIGIGQWTWLEEERMNEIEESRIMSSQRQLSQGLSSMGSGGVASGVTLIEEQESDPFRRPQQWKSGYARERNTKSLKGGPHGGGARAGADGVGALQRGGRYMMAWQFLTSIFWLLTGWFALGLVKMLDKFGIRRRPSWLRKTLGSSKVVEKAERIARVPQQNSLDFWILSDEGVLSLPENDDVDVEFHTKRRLKMATKRWGEEEERQLDSNLYGWWTHGGWWGERDSSGDYESAEQDDDTTSLISMSANASEADWESDGGHDGRRTPTQDDPYPVTRESSPGVDLPLESSQLARLLNPRDNEDRQEARILAHHLTSDRIVTRSQFQKSFDSANARVLTSTRYGPPGFKPTSPSGRLTPDEEVEVLEYLILKKRAQNSGSGPDSSAWRDGAEGLGVGGPQCVVCQSSPRTILAWPCRCLSLCEDCRVSLAMNNFGTCVCCRQEVVGFSRLFVP